MTHGPARTPVFPTAAPSLPTPRTPKDNAGGLSERRHHLRGRAPTLNQKHPRGGRSLRASHPAPGASASCFPHQGETNPSEPAGGRTEATQVEAADSRTGRKEVSGRKAHFPPAEQAGQGVASGRGSGARQATGHTRPA